MAFFLLAYLYIFYAKDITLRMFYFVLDFHFDVKYFDQIIFSYILYLKVFLYF